MPKPISKTPTHMAPHNSVGLIPVMHFSPARVLYMHAQYRKNFCHKTPPSRGFLIYQIKSSNVKFERSLYEKLLLVLEAGLFAG